MPLTAVIVIKGHVLMTELFSHSAICGSPLDLSLALQK